jgi:hypothetical protein
MINQNDWVSIFSFFYFVRDDLSAFNVSYFSINSVKIYCLSDISTSTFENMIFLALTHICYFLPFGDFTNLPLNLFNFSPYFINNLWYSLKKNLSVCHDKS